MVFDDGTSALVPQEKMQAAMQDGGKVVQPMMFDDGSRAMVPLERVHSALQDGGQVIGQAPQRPAVNMEPDNTSAFSENRFTVTPQPGEDFSATMQRAAQAGKTVTPAEIGSQSLKGLMEAPAVMAAAPAIGAAGAASLAAPGETLPRVLPGTITAVKAIGAWAKEHPIQAYIVYDQLRRHTSIIPFIKHLPNVEPEP
jgi:hypothetical protein